MSDSIGKWQQTLAPAVLTADRVFVKAITTIRALSSRSNYGSLPRPPAENRIKLYGLYKQATEGDVEGIMARPVGFTLEDEGARKKWDAWKREQGLSKTEAKRRYIAYLIDTMKVYASGTLEARELLGELEFLWDQIKDLDFDDDDHELHIPFPAHSPLFSQSDRYSTATPLAPPSTYSAGTHRNNLQKIYSHSRRSTTLSEYQRPPRTGHGVQSLPGDPQTADDFKTWQSEINSIINKLSSEFVKRKMSSDSDASDASADPHARLRRRAAHVLRLVGTHAFRVLKSFSISVLAILFLVWCVKRNVIVERTVVRKPAGNLKRHKEELVINMILNTDENKWFIRMLQLVNSFVGFV